MRLNILTLLPFCLLALACSGADSEVDQRATVAGSAASTVVPLPRAPRDVAGALDSTATFPDQSAPDRDRAGVRIVSNAATAGLRVELTGQPALRIGAAFRDTVTFFRVVGGVLTDDGLIIANSGSHEVMYFDARGELIRRVGREGNGPGEFRNIVWIQSRSDGGVNVGDFSRPSRVTALDRDGRVVWMRSFTPPALELDDGRAMFGGSAFHLSAMDDGRIIGSPMPMAVADGVPGPMPLVGALRVYGPDMSVLRDLGPITAIVWYEDPTIPVRPRADLYGDAVLQPSAQGSRLAYVDTSSPRIEVIDEGARSMIILEDRKRVPFEPESIPEGAFASDSLPAYEDLVVDSGLRIWALVHDGDERAPNEWRLFGTNGAVLASVILPSDAVVLDADADRLLLLRRDGYEVESIEVWPLTI